MKIFTIICAAALSVCGIASAQMLPETISVHFTVPVTVGETVFPAGDCTIQVLRGANSSMLKFTSTSTSAGAVLVQANRIINADEPAEGQASVTLTHHEKTYQLDKVLLPDHTGFQVMN